MGDTFLKVSSALHCVNAPYKIGDRLTIKTVATRAAIALRSPPKAIALAECLACDVATKPDLSMMGNLRDTYEY